MNMKMINQQQGAVLIMALILLTILMFIAVSFSRMTTLDIRSAKNYSDNVLMLSIAENTLIEAEENIETITDPNTLESTPGTPKQGFYQTTDPDQRLDPFDEGTWTNSSNVVTVTTSLGTGTYYVEEIMTIPGSGGGGGNVVSVSTGGQGEDATPSGPDVTIFRSVVRTENPTATGSFMIESFYGKAF